MSDASAADAGPAQPDASVSDASPSDGGVITPTNCPNPLAVGVNGATATLATDTEIFPKGDYVLDGKTGFGEQRNNDEFFANFFKKDAAKGTQLDARFGGLHRVGTFACGAKAKPNDDYAVPTSLEVWTSNSNTGALVQFKGSNAGASCSVTVTKVGPSGAEGCYTGTLTATNGKTVAVQGSFRAAK